MEKGNEDLQTHHVALFEVKWSSTYTSKNKFRFINNEVINLFSDLSVCLVHGKMQDKVLHGPCYPFHNKLYTHFHNTPEIAINKQKRKQLTAHSRVIWTS